MNDYKPSCHIEMFPIQIMMVEELKIWFSMPLGNLILACVHSQNAYY